MRTEEPASTLNVPHTLPPTRMIRGKHGESRRAIFAAFGKPLPRWESTRRRDHPKDTR
jgi:hypothetical protein